MLGKVVICGLLAGLVAGLLATGFAQFTGEPAIDDAIAFEESQAALAADGHQEPVISRGTQSAIGLLLANLIYGVALGGLFALVFGVAYGRLELGGPARAALWLAAAAFVVVFFVPFIKYPANPPGVGDPGTIGERTLLYVSMTAMSLLAAVAAARLSRSVSRRHGSGAAAVVAIGSYLLIVLVASLVMPTVSEVPSNFPATTLYEFRLSAIGMQAVLWAALGTCFAYAAQRVMSSQRLSRSTLAG